MSEPLAGYGAMSPEERERFRVAWAALSESERAALIAPMPMPLAVVILASARLSPEARAELRAKWEQIHKDFGGEMITMSADGGMSVVRMADMPSCTCYHLPVGSPHDPACASLLPCVLPKDADAEERRIIDGDPAAPAPEGVIDRNGEPILPARQATVGEVCCFTFGPWTTLRDLREGAIFETCHGTRALKTEYRTFNGGTQCNCYLVESGEAAHFDRQDAEPVREIILDD